MDGSEELSTRVGQIALAQSQVDEWLVQVLISLLRPLPESRTQLLVGKSSLDQKCSLVLQLADDMSLSLDGALPSGATARGILGRVKKLNDERDRAVHSYYGQLDGGQARQFRSRRPRGESIRFDDLASIAEGLEQCGAGLREFVEVLEESFESQLHAGSRWWEVVRGVHELIIAGHLQERGMLDALPQEIDARGSIRIGIRGVKRRVLGKNEDPSEGEHLAEISTTNWQATLTSPGGEVLIFGDTGWRDVTNIAQEEDPGVKFAAIRRVGDNVQISVEGGEMASVPWPQSRDRLAERAFGPAVDSGLEVPDWVLGLDGFRPSRDVGT
ncbi:hypothetical protein [Arthrobacter pigmenti]